MTQEQIQEGNKLIAEFMEIPKCSRCEHDCGAYHFSSGLYYRPDQMKYHSSWDWLMPVWFKIQRYWVNEFGALTSTFELSSMGIEISAKGCEFKWACIFTPTRNYNELNAIWLAVVEFIKWYNKNKEL